MKLDHIREGERFDLDSGLFERIVVKGYSHTQIKARHQMSPEISALVRPLMSLLCLPYSKSHRQRKAVQIFEDFDMMWYSSITDSQKMRPREKNEKV